MLKTLPSQDYKIKEYTSKDIIYRYKKMRNTLQDRENILILFTSQNYRIYISRLRIRYRSSTTSYGILKIHHKIKNIRNMNYKI